MRPEEANAEKDYAASLLHLRALHIEGVTFPNFLQETNSRKWESTDALRQRTTPSLVLADMLVGVRGWKTQETGVEVTLTGVRYPIAENPDGIVVAKFNEAARSATLQHITREGSLAMTVMIKAPDEHSGLYHRLNIMGKDNEGMDLEASFRSFGI